MVYSFEQLLQSGTVALEFIGDNYPGNTLKRLEQFPKKLVSRRFIPSALHQNINNLTILVHSSLQIRSLALNLNDDFIEMPLVRRFREAAANLVGVGLGQLETPFANCFVSNLDASIEHHFFDVSETEGESEVQPDAVGDDLGGKAMSFITDAHSLSFTQIGKLH
jgi:hypothetical protein